MNTHPVLVLPPPTKPQVEPAGVRQGRLLFFPDLGIASTAEISSSQNAAGVAASPEGEAKVQ